MEQKVLTKVEPVKLPWKVKFLYATGDLAKTTTVIMTMAFSMYFYTEVCGINSGVASTIILLAKIWDIINDPMMGAIVDRTKSKEGKCRMWLKYMSVPGAIVFALAFMMPELSATGKIVWVALTYTLQGMASTALMIPMNTLMGRLTSDPVERASLNQIKGIMGLIPNLIVPAATMPMVIFFGKGDMQKGFLMVGIIYAIVFGVFNLTVYFGTKGYEPLEHLGGQDTTSQAAVKIEQPSIGTVLKALLQNTPWLFCIALYLVDMLASSISTTVMTWYFQYNIGSIPLMSLVSTISLGATFAVYLVLGFCIKKFGNSGTAVIGCILSVIGFALRFFLHDGTTAIIIAGNVIANFGTGLVGATILLNIFDAKVYGEWKTGVDNEAILMSGFSVSYKTGQALGGPVAGYLLLTVPYVAQAAVQEQSVLDLWFYESTLLPAVGFAIALVFALLLIKYEKKVPQMRAEIEERKAKEEKVE
ncbi:MFS transporter [Ihubacter sp. mB4P-1]|uniref:MFS transporter n=1 Tax=Ihubacter sp. mB4P-1 TaxID=3242370 RepID=UPI003C79E702